MTRRLNGFLDGLWWRGGSEAHVLTKEELATALEAALAGEEPLDAIKEFVIDPADARAGLAANLDESTLGG
ncbi:hypothetical protein [Streptomyces bohaiensis]|uniref:hypothetical protein n=1 Tax=Streptomyces bohaiensis TaxID=1431344 RepID=UPI003B80B224